MNQEHIVDPGMHQLQQTEPTALNEDDHLSGAIISKRRASGGHMLSKRPHAKSVQRVGW